MRLKRLMSIVLAVAIVMSLAMTASAATTLYYKQDFSQYATSEDASANYLAFYNAEVNTAGPAAITHTDAVYDIPTFRATGKNVFYSGGYAAANNVSGRWYNIGTNGAGDPSLTTNQTSHMISFIPDTSWDGSVKTNESYVISMDISSNTLAARDGLFMALFTKRGNATEPAINRVRMASSYDIADTTYGGLRPNTTQWGYGADSLFKDNDMPTKFAVKLTYDATEGRLIRDWYADGALWSADNVLDMENTTTVEGFGYKFKAGIGFADIKMYTIDNTEGFKVTAPIEGTTVTNLDAGQTVTLTFTQPVYESSFSASDITLTANGTPVDITVGNLVTGTVNGSYASTVDVTLPALAEETNYVLTVDSSVVNEVASTLTDATVAFSTPFPEAPTPDFVVDSITPNTHVAGSMGTVDVVVTNNDEVANKNVAVIYAVYSSAGTLVDVVYANDSLAPTSTTTISAGVKLGSDAARAKVMVWDGLNTINPLNGFTGVNVTAAAQ